MSATDGPRPHKFGDIIQPSDRLGEAVFWDKRAARVKVPLASKAPRVRGQSIRHDPDVERHFRRLYLDGMTYERIGREMGISRSQVARMRRAYNLPKRTDKLERPLAAEKRIPITIHVTEVMDREITMHCRRLGKMKAPWLRGLIRMNLDGGK